MPRIPSIDIQAPRPNLGVASFNPVTGYEGVPAQMKGQEGEFKARGAAEIGQAASNLGHLADQIHHDFLVEREKIDAAKVDEALNRLRETSLDLSLGKEGYATKRGESVLAEGFNEGYNEKLKSGIQSITDGLTSEEQKRKFSMRAGEIAQSFNASMMHHRISETQRFEDESYGKTNQNMVRVAIANYSDEKSVLRSIIDVGSHVADYGKRTGKSPQWVMDETDDQVGKMLDGVIKMSVAEGNPEVGMAYAAMFKKQVPLETLVGIQRITAEAKADRIGTAAAAEIATAVYPAMSPGAYDRLFHLMLVQESGKKQFNADGSVVTSGAGAIGIGQVMPGTGPEAARLAGLPWDEKKLKSDQHYNMALSSAYLSDQLRRFNGDEAKALAAYNAGPTAVEAAIKKAQKGELVAAAGLTAFGVTGDKAVLPGRVAKPWLSFLPEETQKYVKSIMSQYESGAGAPQMPTTLEMHSALRANPAIANNPKALKNAEEKLDKFLKEAEESKKQKEERLMLEVGQVLRQNGGVFSEVPPHIRAMLTPKMEEEARKDAQRVRNGDDSTNWVLYNDWATNPQKLARIGDDEFNRLSMTQMSAQHRAHFAEIRGKLKQSPGGGDVDSARINEITNNTLRLMKLDPTPKDASTDAERVGAIRATINDAISARQLRDGRKLNDVEIQATINSLFANSEKFRTFFSRAGKDKPVLSYQYSDIPGDERKAIEKEMARNGNAFPTDGQILHQWMTWKLKK
jgi:soluble lytic murein transglycosylase